MTNSMTISNQNELSHHGILGQRWGVRRYQNPDGSLTALGRKRMENRNEISDRKDAVKNRRSLSDADLRKRIERLKTEKQLKELTEDDLHPGRAAVKRVLGSVGQKTITTVLTGAALYGAKVMMTKNFDVKEAAAYMTPKPKNK